MVLAKSIAKYSCNCYKSLINNTQLLLKPKSDRNIGIVQAS